MRHDPYLSTFRPSLGRACAAAALPVLLLAGGLAPLTAEAGRIGLLPRLHRAPEGLFVEPRPPVLRPQAFVGLAACRVDPYADPDVPTVASQFGVACGADHVAVTVEGPRADQPDRVVGRYGLGFDQVLTRRPFDELPLATTARVGWSAVGTEAQPRLRTERALVAAGAQVEFGDDVLVGVSVGRDPRPGLRSRSTLQTAWRPWGEHLVYVQWAGEPDGVSNTFGMRWWLVPRRLSVEMSARLNPDGTPVQPRLGMQFVDW